VEWCPGGDQEAGEGVEGMSFRVEQEPEVQRWVEPEIEVRVRFTALSSGGSIREGKLNGHIAATRNDRVSVSASERSI
jgi:hypothetical protein